MNPPQNSGDTYTFHTFLNLFEAFCTVRNWIRDSSKIKWFRYYLTGIAAHTHRSVTLRTRSFLRTTIQLSSHMITSFLILSCYNINLQMVREIHLYSVNVFTAACGHQHTYPLHLQQGIIQVHRHGHLNLALVTPEKWLRPISAVFNTIRKK